jgi:hypothetical protein
MFLESTFIEQAARNGTRPNSPEGVKPAIEPVDTSEAPQLVSQAAFKL